MTRHLGDLYIAELVPSWLGRNQQCGHPIGAVVALVLRRRRVRVIR